MRRCMLVTGRCKCNGCLIYMGPMCTAYGLQRIVVQAVHGSAGTLDIVYISMSCSKPNLPTQAREHPLNARGEAEQWLNLCCYLYSSVGALLVEHQVLRLDVPVGDAQAVKVRHSLCKQAHVGAQAQKECVGKLSGSHCMK